MKEIDDGKVLLVIAIGFFPFLLFLGRLGLLPESDSPEPLREGAYAEVYRIADHYGLPNYVVSQDFRAAGQDFDALKLKYRLKYGY